jgi:hypothetical protein
VYLKHTELHEEMCSSERTYAVNVPEMRMKQKFIVETKTCRISNGTKS